MPATDTIYAVSSGTPPAAIAILRVSGPAAFSVGIALAGRLPEPRQAAVRTLRDPIDGILLDRALVLTFAAPRTATGEDMVEFHVHGGRAVVAAVVRAIGACSGTREATPGEFTRRALENGVIDLTAAEGLGDLLAAETESQRRAALRMAEGGLRTMIDGWTDRLVAVAARIEAQLDFSDEDDVPEEAIDAIHSDIAGVHREVVTVLNAAPVERLKDGVRVVIAGPPNSGKSTLLNAMIGREAAIVSPVSGTTRDRIDASVDRGGVAYVVTDTAGLTDQPGDAIERIGVERAWAAIAGADLVLWLGRAELAPPHSIKIHARADRADRLVPDSGSDISVSAFTGVGLQELWHIVADRAAALLPQADVVATNRRQRSLLAMCAENLSHPANDILVMAEQIRLALRALDEVAGRSGIENVLDAIFANFCIGK